MILVSVDTVCVHNHFFLDIFLSMVVNRPLLCISAEDKMQRRASSYQLLKYLRISPSWRFPIDILFVPFYGFW